MTAAVSVPLSARAARKTGVERPGPVREIAVQILLRHGRRSGAEIGRYVRRHAEEGEHRAPGRGVVS